MYSGYYRVFVSRKVENCTSRFIESCLFRKQYLFFKKHVMYDLVYGIDIQGVSILLFFFNTVLWYFTSKNEKQRLTIVLTMDFNQQSMLVCKKYTM